MINKKHKKIATWYVASRGLWTRTHIGHYLQALKMSLYNFPVTISEYFQYNQFGTEHK
jgi:hypothetical protein